MFGNPITNKSLLFQFEQDINQARLSRNALGPGGNSVLEALVAKYHRRLNSTQGTVLGSLALAESLFEYPQLAFDAFEILPNSNHTGSSNEKCKELLVAAISAAQTQQDSPPVYLAQANTLLALHELLSFQPSAALHRLEAINQASLQEASIDLSSYGPTSLIMYYVVYAWTLYEGSNLEKAKLMTEKGVSYLASIPTNSSAAPNDSAAFLFWFETCIYTMVALCKSGDAERASPACALFLDRFNAFEFRDNLKAIAILYSHIKLQISKLDQSPPLDGIPNFATGSLKLVPSDTVTILKDISKWLPHYEYLATKLYTFPKGGSKTPLEIERYSRVLQAFDWWVQVEMYRGKIKEDSLTEYLERHYSILETLYRGTNHAFHSLRLLRYISHTFLSLVSVSPYNICREEIKEAKKAIESYIFHWEKHFTLLLDSKKKEKLVRMSKSHNRVSTSSRPYQSHRMSGSITQYPELATFTLALESPAEEGEDDEYADPIGNVKPAHVPLKSPQVSFLGEGVEESVPVVIIEEVDGETVPDVVGVLITGMRLLLQTYEGNVEVLKTAATYGEKAFVILSEHGTSLFNYNQILGQVFQWLGIVYGELALEVVGRDDRLRHQEEAIIMLSKARTLQKTNHIARYQLALQLSEVGEFQQAVDEINRAIKLDPTVPSYYNLLALMLSAKSQIEKALVLANAGWNHCLKHVFTINNVDNENQLIWESVDNYYRDDLVNLRLTIISLEIKKSGPKSVIDSLDSISAQLRRIVGVKVSLPSVQEDIPRKMENERGSLLSTGHLRKSVSISKTNNSISSSSNILPRGIHRIGSFDLQLNLCLLSSSVYRECGLIENALIAIEDGERMLLNLSKFHHNIRNQESRIFRDAEVKSGHITSSSGYWKESDPVLARFQADIALEKAFIQYSIYKAQSKPKLTSPYIKYLSPLARIEVDRQAALRKDLREARKSSSSGSMKDSFDSISVSQVSSTSEHQNSSAAGIDANGNAQFLKAQAPEYPPDDDESNSKIVTIDRVITIVQFALLFDMHHLPARTFLGMLLREKGDLSQSEHHLQRACTQQKHRGSSSGRSGMSSVFGGVSSQWGWLSWNQLALNLYDLGRSSDAEKAALYSLQLHQNCSTRGYECLFRF